VKAFIEFLKTPEATAVMRDKGMQVNLKEARSRLLRLVCELT